MRISSSSRCRGWRLFVLFTCLFIAPRVRSAAGLRLNVRNTFLPAPPRPPVVS
jgi:hypothetical protein